MLPLIVLDPNEKNCAALYRIAREEAAQSECPVALLVQAADVADAENAADACDGVLMMMAAAHADSVSDIVALSLCLLERCRDSYFIYFAASAAVLEVLVNGCVRPAGLLLPPFTKGKLRAILKRVFEDYLELQKPRRDQLLVSVNGSTLRLPRASVVCVEASEKRLTLFTSRQSLAFSGSLKVMGQKLGDGFLQCHRAFLINVRRAERLDLGVMEIVMDNGMRVPVARSHKRAVAERFHAISADVPFIAENEPFVGLATPVEQSVVG